jgi:hypothetical protein
MKGCSCSGKAYFMVFPLTPRSRIDMFMTRKEEERQLSAYIEVGFAILIMHRWLDGQEGMTTAIMIRHISTSI